MDLCMGFEWKIMSDISRKGCKMPIIRIDKLIANQHKISRKDVRQIIKKGRVTINGKTETLFDKKINTDMDKIELDGKDIVYKNKIYVMLNKPMGYVCSTKDGESPTVLEILSDELRVDGMFPAGRLDKDTEGFVFLTNDGELAHKMLSPKKHVPKYYFVRLARAFEDEYVEKFHNGIMLADGDVCLPSRVRQLENGKNEAIIELCEGKYHQVKRMFAAVGNHVEYLQRFQIGGLEMNAKLSVGEYLEILHKDVDKLWITDEFDAIFAKVNQIYSS